MKKNQLQLKRIKPFLIMAFILLSISGMQAIVKTATTGNWNAAGTWTPSGVPASTDDIIIPTGVNVTLNQNHTLNSGYTFTLDGIVRFTKNTNWTLTINGTIIFNATSYVTGDNTGNNHNTFALGSGANLKTANTDGLTGAAASIRNSTITVSLSTAANYEFNGVAQSTTGLPATVNNLTFSGSGAKALDTNKLVSGVFTLGGTATLNTNAFTFGYTGANYGLKYETTDARTVSTTEWPNAFSGSQGVIIAGTGVITNSVTKTGSIPITIAPGSKLTNNGSLTATTFTIQSDATSGTGTYLGSGTVTATTTNVNQALNVYRGWYMTSPVSGTVTPTPNAGTLTIYRYLESENDDQTTGVSWLTSTTMTSNQGYSVTPSGAGTTQITFTGSLNDGNKSFALTRNDHAGKSKNGFNLIGNPYPSYLDWTALYTANSSLLPEATMYYRTKVGSIYYFWTVNGSGIGVPSQASKYVPPMQAFWVRTITGGGTLNVTNAMRLHNPSGSNLLKAPASKTSENRILRLQVSNGTASDEAVVYFNANAADGFDAYDSPKMINGSSSTVPDIYTTVGTEVLSINGMTTIPYDTEIPLYFVANASAGTSYSITANELSNFEAGTQVWIKNILSGVSHLVSEGTPFTFDIADSGTNPKFSIIIKAPGAETKIDYTDKSNTYAYLNANNQITVSCSDALSADANVSVYNSLGQRIVRKPLTKSVTRIDNQLTAGVYLLTVINAGNKTTEKIIIH